MVGFKDVDIMYRNSQLNHTIINLQFIRDQPRRYRNYEPDIFEINIFINKRNNKIMQTITTLIVTESGPGEE